MKDWIRAHPYQAFALGYVAFFVLSTGIWMAVGRTLEDAVTTAVIWTLGYAAFAYIGLRQRLKAKARLDDHGQLRAYIRYPETLSGSLGRIWNQGILTPGDGTLLFQPAVYDSLEPSGRPVTLKVRGVLPERRKVTGKDRGYIQEFDVQALTLLTDGGTVEIAGRPETLEQLAERLGVDVSEG
ncbi:hypothetical protein [Pseudarthrobacter sp. C4D7]|uniref:hypothetical protein n=1 Tax=Pseudarthrobacter sp. C4D7 TaxID=2735268 RepID=UPI00158456F4|nr:hypothetical protein [Pseudarthrobacter sp. C4D7]NUT69597.1 hypothetical protein [Pseudarthrobacter sp. C4D7]